MHCQGAGRGHCSGTWVFGLPAGGLLPSTPRVARSWGAACNAPDFDLDLDGAFRDIKDLIRRGLTVGEKKGGRVYRVLETAAPSAVPEDLEPLLAPLRANGFIKNADVRDRLGIIAVRHSCYSRNGPREIGSCVTASGRPDSISRAPICTYDPASRRSHNS